MSISHWNLCLVGSGGTKRCESLWADLAWDEEWPTAWRQTTGSKLNILGKHQTRLQDFVAEKVRKNIKDTREKT
jgi:hypothetical protein